MYSQRREPQQVYKQTSLLQHSNIFFFFLIITIGKFQQFDWLRRVQLIINFCVTKEI